MRLNRLFLRTCLVLRRGDGGAETVDVMLWIGVIIVIVGAAGYIYRNDVVAFFHSLQYTIGFTSGS